MGTNPLGDRRHFWDKFLNKYSKLAVNGIVTGEPTGESLNSEPVKTNEVEEIVVGETDLDDDMVEDEEEEDRVEETEEEPVSGSGGVTVIDDAIPNEEFEGFMPDPVHVEL